MKLALAAALVALAVLVLLAAERPDACKPLHSFACYR